MPFGLLPSLPVADPGLEHATNHRERAIATLLSQLRDLPRFEKLVEILVKPLQEIEDVIWQLYTLRRIDTAEGEQLDIIGRILDEPRQGLSDDDYRPVLRAKAKTLFSRGTGPNLIKIARLFLGNYDFTYQEFHPAAIEMIVTDVTAAGRVRLLARLLRKAKAGGVRIDIVDGTGGPHFRYGTGVGTGFGYGEAPYAGIV